MIFYKFIDDVIILSYLIDYEFLISSVWMDWLILCQKILWHQKIIQYNANAFDSTKTRVQNIIELG